MSFPENLKSPPHTPSGHNIMMINVQDLLKKTLRLELSDLQHSIFFALLQSAN